MIPPRNRHPRAESPRNHARFVRTTATPDSNASASHSDESSVNNASPTTAPPKTAPQLITGRLEPLTVARAGPIEISRAISHPPSNDLLSDRSRVPSRLHVNGRLVPFERLF